MKWTKGEKLLIAGSVLVVLGLGLIMTMGAWICLMIAQESTQNTMRDIQLPINVQPSKPVGADLVRVLEEEAKSDKAHRKAMAELYKLAEEDPPAVIRLPILDIPFLLEARLSESDYENVLDTASQRDPVGVANRLIDRYESFDKLPRYISRALINDPKWVKGWLNRGHIRAFRYGDLVGGRSDAMKVIELSPNSKEAASAHVILASIERREAENLKTLGKVREFREKIEKGIHEIEKANAIFPSGSSYMTLAHLYEDIGKIKEAVEAAKKAIKLDPKTQRAYVIINRYEKH